MKDMKSIIGRIILAFIMFIAIITIYGLYGETGEDKREIRKDEDRIVEYIKEKVELQNKEEIREIKFVKYKKNVSTGSWRYDVVINDKIDLHFTSWREREKIVLSASKEGDINLVENKKNMNESNIEVIYAK
ncbi:hypothetical protein [Gemella sanguinis]|uniref:hypothetical protein n=1 Tax=Gemella sanguinis TaxID=84135 RepID=UPI0004E1EB27|nr:hypothetical protein [Gemella sanguinis]NKZ26055.1 hypothetical protein [Gemella sanguinis]